MNRKEFIKNSSLASTAYLLSPSKIFNFKSKSKISIGLIGVGLRGQNHLELLLKRDDVNIIALCDINETMLQMCDEILLKSGKDKPKVFKEDKYAWKKLLEIKELDAVIISTPWEWHTPMIIGAIEAGIKYIGTEVVLGINLEDHWNVVRSAEKHNAHVMMLENVCYRRDVMAILNMVRQNLFGEIIHLQGGYQHDLREVKFNNGVEPYGHGVEYGEKAFSEASWRTEHSIHRNGDLYPTHGIGPLANYININRGNRFVRLNSFSSKARGLHNHIVKHGGEKHPNAKIEFKLGDVITTQISCANGETIMLQHDTNLPRPYSLGFRVQGTNGIWMDLNNSIYIEGLSKNLHRWDSAKDWLEKYDHPLWKRWINETKDAGHGGMDFFVVHAFVESVKRNAATPLDVYDAASWSAITPLSEQSINLGNETIDFPDFTSGQWMYRKPVFALTNEY